MGLIVCGAVLKSRWLWLIAPCNSFSHVKSLRASWCFYVFLTFTNTHVSFIDWPERRCSHLDLRMCHNVCRSYQNSFHLPANSSKGSLFMGLMLGMLLLDSGPTLTMAYESWRKNVPSNIHQKIPHTFMQK